MVWGLRMPSGLGDYFPEGSFVGWNDWLKSFPNNVDGKIWSYMVVDKFNREIGRPFTPNYLPVEPIAEHEWPKWYETKKRYATLGSLFEMSGRILAVEEALKDLIERLEPDVHQFRPITLTTHKGGAYPKRYYVLVIGQFMDSFSPEKSVEGSWELNQYGNSYSAFLNSKRYIEGLALSSTVFGKAHLWRERKLSSPEFFLSDTLHDEIVKAGLRVPRHYRMKEVET